MRPIVFKSVESKSIVWFKPSNQYLVLDSMTASIIGEILENKKTKVITSELISELDIPYKKAIEFILDLNEKIVKPCLEHKEINTATTNNLLIPSSFEYSKFYRIHTRVFNIRYSNEIEVSLIHPKFAHLQCERSENVDHVFKIFNQGNYILFMMDNDLIGSWGEKEIHYFQGKVSMKIIETIYNKQEEDWMGVFHASAVGLDKNSILLLGDSGTGKSTSLAILQAAGLNCIADDFVPIDNNSKVHVFPAGISIKKAALETLFPIYPEIKSSTEYYYQRWNKRVRYLPPFHINYDHQYRCKALVFIKYDKSVDFSIDKISNLEAFNYLIPDSWISQTSKNVDIFLDWFSSLPCYRLTYSNNQKMIENITTILTDDL